ncbi:MAG: hypothetical protein QNJ32_30375 [Xenococcaceae cyanobacterium MO_167.B27]|nr:hypothetical protein [Xenococcaceae cyanobacterium MO_167.B27]
MKGTTTKNSYIDQDIFIGIDVHKKTYYVVARVNQEIVKKWTAPASPQKLGEQLLKYFGSGRIHTAYFRRVFRVRAPSEASEPGHR